MRSAQPVEELRGRFTERFGRACMVVARAPGRVNLIGEHVDYNDGFVLPMALEQSTWVAAGPRADGRVRAVSLALHSEQTWSSGAWRREAGARWTAYVAGVEELLRARGVSRTGCDLLIRSDVPVGGGLSSSAALELAVATALAALAEARLEPVALAELCRQAEHEYAGVPCGIMDQYVSALARRDCALLLDCRARTGEHIPLALGDHVIAVIDSGVRHELAAGEYRQRQEQCRVAREFFARRDSAVRALRDVTPDMLARHVGELDAVAAARARHVTSEIARTRAAAAALRQGDLALFGRLMNESHCSLRDDYAVSVPEIDRLAEIVWGVPGVLGARLTGGGFGGCVVALLHGGGLPALQAALQAQYDAAGLGPARVLLSRAGAGAEVCRVGG